MKNLKRTISLLLALSLLAALAACGAQPTGEAMILAKPAAPEELSAAKPSYRGLTGFTAQSLPVILADLDGENRVYSPLNLYLALGMLAELSDGESRAQLMELLGSDDIESLRKEAKGLFAASWSDEDWLTVLPAASVWLRDGGSYKQGALQRLAEDYFAAAFSVPMGSESADRALHDWINEQTKHLLEQQTGQLHLDADTMLALVTTLYFKGTWSDHFFDSMTQRQPFHAVRGDREAEFMRQTLTMDYYRGEHFGAIWLPMQGGAGMWLLLPDEDSSLQALIDSGEAAALLAAGGDWADKKEYRVHLSLPKFDVSGDLSLIDALQALGVTDMFDAALSDFSPLTDARMKVSKVQHAARVKIDEDGCEGAAFTVIEAPAEAPADFEKPEEIDFVCDRPFLFAVTGRDSVLFLGAVNDPTA